MFAPPRTLFDWRFSITHWRSFMLGFTQIHHSLGAEALKRLWLTELDVCIGFVDEKIMSENNLMASFKIRLANNGIEFKFATLMKIYIVDKAFFHIVWQHENVNYFNISTIDSQWAALNCPSIFPGEMGSHNWTKMRKAKRSFNITVPKLKKTRLI